MHQVHQLNKEPSGAFDTEPEILAYLYRRHRAEQKGQRTMIVGCLELYPNINSEVHRSPQETSCFFETGAALFARAHRGAGLMESKACFVAFCVGTGFELAKLRFFKAIHSSRYAIKGTLNIDFASPMFAQRRPAARGHPISLKTRHAGLGI